MSESELAQRVRALEERVATLEAVDAVVRLKARYGSLVDARYDENGVASPERVASLADEIAALFTEDAEWDGGPTLGVQRGRDAIRARFCEPTLLFSVHYFVGPEITVDGDRAEGRWDLLSPCTLRDGRPFWMSGAERDEYRRVDGVWLHHRMQLDVAFFAPHEKGWGKRGAR